MPIKQTIVDVLGYIFFTLVLVFTVFVAQMFGYIHGVEDCRNDSVPVYIENLITDLNDGD